MAATIDIHHESLSYTGTFARPPLELWGAGGRIVRGFCDALAPYNVTLRNIHVSSVAPTAADTIITIQIGTAVLKFSFEKIEVAFTGFSVEEFLGIPKFLQRSTEWLSDDFPFASHEAQYFCHSFLKGSTADEFLKKMNPTSMKSAGVDLGAGAVFYRAIPEKAWTTQLTVDKSQHFPGALFIAIKIAVARSVDYDDLLVEGREYLRSALSELGLILPELEESRGVD
jgi:hypothetical protein